MMKTVSPNSKSLLMPKAEAQKPIQEFSAKKSKSFKFLIEREVTRMKN